MPRKQQQRQHVEDGQSSPTLPLLHSTPSTAGLSASSEEACPPATGAGTTASPSTGGTSKSAMSSSTSMSNNSRRRTARALCRSAPSTSWDALPDEDIAGSSASLRGGEQSPPPLQQHPSTLSLLRPAASSAFSEPTPRTFETAISSPPRSARLLFSGRSLSSGYGWYAEDEDALDVGSLGRGHEGHLAVLQRMETARDDLEASITTTSRGYRPAPSSSTGEDEEEQEQQEEDEEAAAEDERARVVAQASSAQRRQREQQHLRGEAMAMEAAGKQVLFALPQRDFNVLTKTFAREHCGPLLLELAAAAPVGAFDSSGVSGAGTMFPATQHATKQRGSGKPKDCFLALGVGGFRIVQDSSGNQYAEYNLILCLDAATYVVWRRYSHIAALFEEARAAHGDSRLPLTWDAWTALEQQRKWRRCLSVPYLTAKLAHIEALLQALVAESQSPALLLRFVSPGSDD